MQLWRRDRDRDASFVSNRASSPDEELLDAYSSAVVGVVEAVSPSVVHVQVRGARQGRMAQGSGSGTLLSPDGIVLTNNHVVEGASSIELSLTDARRLPARIIGRDPDDNICIRYCGRFDIAAKHIELIAAEARSTMPVAFVDDDVIAVLNRRGNKDRIHRARFRNSTY